MSRMPLVEPEALPPYLKAIHDATPEENWLGRHFARAFAPNPDLVQAYQAFYTPWHTGGRIRRAGVSSFGFTGTNAHVLIEEAPPRQAASEPDSPERPVSPQRPVDVLPFSPTKNVPTPGLLRNASVSVVAACCWMICLPMTLMVCGVSSNGWVNLGDCTASIL